jgi:putative ABC transport system permease protein
LYTPTEQIPDQLMVGLANGVVVVMRTSVPPASLIPAIRREISALEGPQLLIRVRTMDEIIIGTQAPRRFLTFLLSVFAIIAVSLAIVGIYGVLSYFVNQKMREIGVRMALGARPASIFLMVIGDGIKLALIGVCIGIAGALTVTRFLSGLLYRVAPADPFTFVSVILLLLGVALIACYIPARRATKVDPMVALRHE